MNIKEFQALLKAKVGDKEYQRLLEIFAKKSKPEIAAYLAKNWNEINNFYPLYKKHLFLLEDKTIKQLQDPFIKSINDYIGADNKTMLNKMLQQTKQYILQQTKQDEPIYRDEFIKISEEQMNAYNEKFNNNLKNIFSTRISLPRNGLELIQKNWIDDNVKLITKLQKEEADIISNIVRDNFIAGGRADNIKKQILDKVDGIKKNRAILIAEDQALKLHSQVNIQQQKNIGCTEYVWNTQRDNRVRDTHVAKDGQVFKYGVDEPGTEIRCRCYAVGVVKFEFENN